MLRHLLRQLRPPRTPLLAQPPLRFACEATCMGDGPPSSSLDLEALSEALQQLHIATGVLTRALPPRPAALPTPSGSLLTTSPRGRLSLTRFAPLVVLGPLLVGITLVILGLLLPCLPTAFSSALLWAPQCIIQASCLERRLGGGESPPRGTGLRLAYP